MLLTEKHGLCFENLTRWWVPMKIWTLLISRSPLPTKICCDRSQALMACLSRPSIPCKRWMKHSWAQCHHQLVLQDDPLTILCFKCESNRFNGQNLGKTHFPWRCEQNLGGGTSSALISILLLSYVGVYRLRTPDPLDLISLPEINGP